MKKIHINSFIVVDELEEHNSIKNDLLEFISNADSHVSQKNDSYYSDSVSKLDWRNCTDMNRPWVSKLMPSLSRKMNTIAETCGYQTCSIHEIWFQQYLKGNTHGWHTHGHNFTCVYYLEFPEGSPQTELVDPFLHHHKFTANVKEGSVIMFPSYVIHRAPIVECDVRKTIISFNVNVNEVSPKTLMKVNML